MLLLEGHSRLQIALVLGYVLHSIQIHYSCPRSLPFFPFHLFLSVTVLNLFFSFPMLCEQTAALFLFWAEGLPYLLSLHKEACQSFSFSNIDDQNCKRAPAFHCLNCKYLMDTINWCLIVTCVQVVYNQVQHSICWKLIFQQKHFPLVPEYLTLYFAFLLAFPTQGLKLTQFPVMSHFSAVLLAVPRFVTSRLHWHIPKVCAKPPGEVNKQDFYFFFWE